MAGKMKEFYVIKRYMPEPALWANFCPSDDTSNDPGDPTSCHNNLKIRSFKQLWFFRPLVGTVMSSELADLDWDGVKWSTTRAHACSTAIHSVSGPGSSPQAYLESFHPLISRLPWLWWSHPCPYLSLILCGKCHTLDLAVSFPVSPGSCLLYSDRESLRELLCLFTFP